MKNYYTKKLKNRFDPDFLKMANPDHPKTAFWVGFIVGAVFGYLSTKFPARIASIAASSSFVTDSITSFAIKGSMNRTDLFFAIVSAGIAALIGKHYSLLKDDKTVAPLVLLVANEGAVLTTAVAKKLVETVEDATKKFTEGNE